MYRRDLLLVGLGLLFVSLARLSLGSLENKRIGLFLRAFLGGRIGLYGVILVKVGLDISGVLTRIFDHSI